MKQNEQIYITECPRDAMQGISSFIPTGQKIDYLNHLLRVGFDTLDFGSFVSPKAVPQMADTEEVLSNLDWQKSKSRLLAIVLNMRGAEQASSLDGIEILGYPFSISETFQLRNARKTIAQSYELVKDIKKLCEASNKELAVYLSMAFGNPYGDPWNLAEVKKWIEEMAGLGIKKIILADTVGSSSPSQIEEMFSRFITHFPNNQICAHFHARPDEAYFKIKAAWSAGCRHFDSAMLGYGGCPFAKDELVGNISTETVLEFCKKEGIPLKLNLKTFEEAQQKARRVFP